jgi:hypothetical protein
LKTVGLVAGAVGVAGLGFGSVAGLVAKSKNDQALQNCRTSTLCSQTGLSLTNDAKSWATISTAAFVAGGVLAAGGLTMFLVAPRGPSVAGLRVTPVIGGAGGSVFVDGSF